MYYYDSLFVKTNPSPRNTNNEPSWLGQAYVCHNALQTSLIRENIRRRISSTINCEIQNRMQSYKNYFKLPKKSP